MSPLERIRTVFAYAVAHALLTGSSLITAIHRTVKELTPGTDEETVDAIYHEAARTLELAHQFANEEEQWEDPQ